MMKISRSLAEVYKRGNCSPKQPVYSVMTLNRPGIQFWKFLGTMHQTRMTPARAKDYDFEGFENALDDDQELPDFDDMVLDDKFYKV